MFPVIICVAREQNSEVDATFTVLISVAFQCTVFRRTGKDQRNGLRGIRMGQISTTVFSENERGQRGFIYVFLYICCWVKQ